ncbi:MAG: hypothetical protein COA42_18740 [Alteromonadaceae bacterium]|nr:MAG: hypothetical protein COA42_18740 [Alteromonadaceae bacterium]
MKFDNLINMNTLYRCRSAFIGAAIITSLALGSGCNSTSVKPEVESDAVVVTMLSTEEYIPQLSLDKEGLTLPYMPSIDPYSLQKGQLKKQDIVTFIEAKRAVDQGKGSEAKILLSMLIDRKPKLSGPWVLLGDLAFAEKDLSLAVRQYQKAIDLNPGNINAHLKRALTQRMQGEFLEAQNSYALALTRWPDFPEAHLNLAILYDIYLNHPIRAQRHYEAYQFLTGGHNTKVKGWLDEVQQRTGIARKLSQVHYQLVQVGVQ